MQIIKAMLDGTMTVAPRARFGIADVRDVADLHQRPVATPAAAGKRFLALSNDPASSFIALAAVLHEHPGDIAARVPTEEAPGRGPTHAGHPQRPRPP